MRSLLSEKQLEIMRLIQAKSNDCSLLDLTQLRESLSYTASKQAILASVNHLIERGLIERTAKEKRNSRMFTTLRLTSIGDAVLASNNNAEHCDDIESLCASMNIDDIETALVFDDDLIEKINAESKQILKLFK